MSRSDGRANDQLRPVTIEPGFQPYAEGSVLISMGNTKVICSVTVEENTAKFLRGTGKGWITAEYSMLPRSTLERTPREVAAGRPSGRTQEIQRLIGRSLRAVADLEALGERTLLVDCDALQADGGTRTAAITGSFVALRLAVNKLLAAGVIDRDPLLTSVAAVSVGKSGDDLLLDLCYTEDSTADVDFNVVMTGQGRFVEVQGTAEHNPFSRQDLTALIDLAEKGIRELRNHQTETIARSR